MWDNLKTPDAVNWVGGAHENNGYCKKRDNLGTQKKVRPPEKTCYCKMEEALEKKRYIKQ